MSFNLIRSFRPLSRIVHPSLFSSNFLGGPSAKTMVPMTGGANNQPVPAVPPHQPFAGLTVLTGSDHWKVERVVAVAMLAIIPGSFVFDSAVMNYLLAASLAIHAHWGMDTVLLDYCPRQALPLANAIRYALTAIAFGGLCYFNYNDMGLTRALKMLWAMH